jgi:hypothetical protein
MRLCARSLPIQLLAAVLSTSLTVSGARADAPRGPSVLVLPFQSAQSEISALISQRLTDLVKAELGRGGNIAVLEPSAPPKAPPPPDSPRREGGLDDAARLYEEGRAKVKKGDFEDAAQTLARALQRIEEGVVLLSDYGLLADAHLWHGIALFRAGSDGEGRSALHRALVLRPDLRLDPQRYPPLFLRIVEEVRSRVLSGSRATASVASVPPGCEVLVDGVVRGRTPAEVKDLLAGRHYFRVSCAGYEPQAVVREVPADAPASLSFTMVAVRSGGGDRDPIPAALGRLRRGLVDDRTVAAAHEAALRSLADYALMGYLVRGADEYELHAWVFRAQDGRLAPLAPSRLDLQLLGAGKAAEALARAVVERVRSFPPASAPVARIPQAAASAGPTREVRTQGDLARVEKLLAREELERLAREERERRLGPLGLEEFTRPSGDGAKPFYKTWWFWSIVGAVVAGGVAGAAAASAGGSGSANVGIRWTPP